MKYIKAKRSFTLILTILFLSQQTMLLPVLASDITGVDGIPIDGGNKQFDINPQFNHGDTGFRHYNNFNLSQGDIANLIFALKNGGDISKFVNLVDSQIIINGLVNSVLRGGGFNPNGNVVFVSPQGMLVGASGVLNVGSLTAIAPAQSSYDTMKMAYTPNWNTGHGDPQNPVLSIVNGFKTNADGSQGAQMTDNEQAAFDINGLKISDQNGDITVHGKIYARDGVELIAKNIKVAQDKTVANSDKAGIFAGIDKTDADKNLKLASEQQAKVLFDSLVNNNIENGAGFANVNGKIIIKAQSIKNITNVDVASDTVTEGELALQPKPSTDYIDPAALEKNASSVVIENAVLGAHDIDVSATTKVVYSAKKGAPSLNYISNTDSTAIGQLLSGGYLNYEGARAKATVTIGDGAELAASGDVLLNSIAIATTNMKVKPLGGPLKLADVAELYYAAGTQTVSDLTVKDGAKITAGEDFIANATSKNTMWAKIKNLTTLADKALLPNWQVVVLNATTDAKTNALIENGAQITAKNVEVNAVNVTNDFISIAAKATVSDTDSLPSLAAGVIIRNSDIGTNAKIDTKINTHNKGNVSVNAQNLNVASVVSSATVGAGKDLPAGGSMLQKVTENAKKIQDKISGLLGTFIADAAPNASGSVVVNTSNTSANAAIGPNANIHADNVSVNSNTIDLTVNNATAKVKDEKTVSYMPTPGVAVIVNNQTNNTTASIADESNGAKSHITANKDLKVNATLEQPMNERTFQFLLDLAQLGNDIYDAGSGASTFETGQNGAWDLSGITSLFTDNVGEIMGNIKNVRVGMKLSGATSTLGLKGFFNNWAESASNVDGGGIGLAGSFVYSEILNNTKAKIGDGVQITNSGNVTVNAANKIVQNNAAGDISKLWKLVGSSGESSGLGGSGVVSLMTNNASAQIGNNVNIQSKGDVGVYSGNQESYINLAITGSSTKKGLAFAGSTVVQELRGSTISSIGASVINADNITVSAGKGATIATAKRAFDRLVTDPFKDMDSNVVVDDVDLTTPQIYHFLGLNEDTGKLDTDTPSAISDGVSNIMITGALASQKAETEGGSGQTSSSGVAIGASVGYSDIQRNVTAYIADGADITATESVKVEADSMTQALNIAVAGAFAGGTSVKKDKDGKSQNKNLPTDANKNNMLSKWQDKTDLLNSKVENKTNNSTTKTDNATNKNINDKLKNDSTKKDLNNASGDKNKKEGLGNSLTEGKTTKTDNASTASKNMSIAAAGTVNVQMTENNVTAAIGKADIKVGKNLDVTANQKTQALNVGTGVAFANTVGAGAAINMHSNSNTTQAIVGALPNTISHSSSGVTIPDKTNITFNANNEHNLNIKANEDSSAIDVAIGVGIAKNSEQDTQTTVSIGGSFNADVLENSVKSELKNTVVKKTAGQDISVNVKADNKSTAYKGAGGLSVSVPTQGTTSVGAGMAGNLNLINKTTEAKIENSVVENAKVVNVTVNKTSAKPTEDLISVGVAGAVITGGKASYSFTGAVGADVIGNTLNAAIDSSNLTSSGNVLVAADNHVKNGNITGAVTFSRAPKGVGVGLGTVVNVITSTVNSLIKDSIISANGDIDVNAVNNEDMKFLAVNMGVTTGATGATVNAIVNVLNSTVGASVSNTEIAKSNSLDVIADYDTSIEGITAAAGAALGKGNALGGNAVVNVMNSNVNASVTGTGKEGKKILSNGDVKVIADSNENIDIIPAGISISTGGPVAASANIGVNVIDNTTSAKIENANIQSASLDVEAKDTTTSKSRGGTIAVSGKTAGVGGSILLEILDKDVDAAITNSKINSNGNVTVNALAENIFGPKDTTSITADAIIAAMGKGDLNDVSSLGDWQMTFDLAGGAKAGVSGSLIAKISQNNVNAAIKGSDITADDVSVKAENGIYTRNIVGNITGGGKAAIGGSMFVNVNLGNTDARIEDSVVTANGDVLVKADSIQDFKTIMVIGGGAGTVAVNGSANSNTAEDTTTALIKNSDIKKSKSVTVQAKAKDDVESLNLGAQGAGTASVGGIVYNNNYLNTVTAGIEGKKADGIISSGKVKVDAKSSESFSANIAMVSGAGTAAINGVAIINVIDADINSYIKNSTVKADSVDIFANHNFNKEKYGDKTNFFTDFMDTNGDNTVTTESFNAFLPTVMVLSVAGAGTAAVTGNAIVDTINAQTVASVSGSTIDTVKGLNINASADEVIYNAMAGIAGAGNVAVGASVNTNILKGTTKAELKDSVIKNGDVSVEASQNTNLNTVLFMAAGAGTGAGVSAVAAVNTISNNTIAMINNSQIENASKTKVSAKNKVQANSIGVAASGVGVGAGVNGLTLTNVSTGNTSASIENGSVIAKGFTNVDADSDTTMYNMIAGGTFAGAGASVGAYVPVNVLNNTVKAYISDSDLNGNSSKTSADKSGVSASSDAILKTLVAVAGITGTGASIGATALVNVIDNDVLAYTKNSSVSGGDFSISAEQTSELSGGIASVNVAGLGVGGNLNSVTNTLKDRVKAYADNLISKNTNLDVNAKSDVSINYGVAALGGGGIAGATGAAVVNIIDNDLAAHIENSSIEGGAIDIDSNQTITSDNGIVGASVGAGAVGGGTVVNQVTNSNLAYVSNTYANVSSIAVNAKTKEDITSNNIIGAVSGVASGAVSALVNVLEGTTHAFIDAGTKNITSAGAITVESDDTLNLKNLAGSLAVAPMGGAVGASVNVNIINNAVKSELLGSGQITADSVSVSAKSNTDYAVGSSAAAIGAAGVAGTVSVTSIGDRFSTSEDLSETDVNNSVTKAQTSMDSLGDTTDLFVNTDGTITTKEYAGVGAVPYKNYNEQKVSLTKGVATAKEGTIANINANVTSKKGITVSADNKSINALKNLTVAGGLAGVGASVNVTNTKYRTTAQITSGRIISETGNVEVAANSSTEADKKGVSGTAGLISVNANVDYFSNDSLTEALTLGGTIAAENGNVILNAISKDVIDMKAISVSGGLADIGASIALAKTNNKTTASLGSAVNASNLTIESINSSDLTTSMEAGSLSFISAKSTINKAESNAVTSALIDAEGKDIVLKNDLNMKSASTGVNVTNNVTVGTASVISADYNNYGAIANSEFNTLIKGGNITAKNANIKAGLKAEETNGKYNITNSTANVTAKVAGKQATIGLANGSGTKMSATTAGNVKAGATGGTLKADNINITSALKRQAKSESSSAAINAVNIGSVELHTKTGGDTTIDTSGAKLTANRVNLSVNEATAADSFLNTAESNAVNGSLTFINGSGSKTTAEANENATIKTGSINADNINMNVYTSKQAKVNNATKSLALVGVSASLIDTSAGGESGITTTGTIQNKAGDGLAAVLSMNVTDKTHAENEAISTNYGLVTGQGLNIKSSVNSSINNVIGGTIKAENIDIHSNMEKTSIANAAANTGGLGAISAMIIESNLTNGAFTTVSGAIETKNMNINSNTTNTVKTYIENVAAGLVAIAHGSAKNNIGTKDKTSDNKIVFNNAKINASKNVNANVNNTNQIAIIQESSTNGFIVVKGGKIENNIYNNTAVEVNNTNIKAENIKLKSSTDLKTLDEGLKYDDDLGGFIVEAGAELKNAITQSNNILIKNGSQLVASKDILLDTISNAKFEQYVKSDSKGTGCYNRADSDLNIVNNSTIALEGNGTAVEAGEKFIINMDSSNILSSEAKVSASHFAGQPGARAVLNLYINNQVRFDNGTNVKAGKDLSINFMQNSINILRQYTDVYAQAAVASADHSGNLFYTNDNLLDVKTNAKLSSMKDVNINYSNGSNFFTSLVKYKKVSRLLLGIPITSSDSYAPVVKTYRNKLNNDGTIEAGVGSQKHLVIDQDGKVTKSDGFLTSDYTLQEAHTQTSEEVTGIAIADIQERMNQLLAQLYECEKESDGSYKTDENGAYIPKTAGGNPILKSASTKEQNDNAIAEYTVLKTTLTNILNELNDANKTISPEAVSNDFKNYIIQQTGKTPNGTTTVQTTTIENEKIVITKTPQALPEGQYDRLWTFISNNIKDGTYKTAAEAIAAFRYIAIINITYEGKNEVTSGLPEAEYNYDASLSSTLQAKILEAYNNRMATLTESVIGNENGISVSLSKYNGKYIIPDANEKNNMITNLTDAKNSYDALIADLKAVNSDLGSKDSQLQNSVTNYKAQISELIKNPLDAITLANNSYVFNDFSFDTSSINIKNLSASGLTGSGNFATPNSVQFVVDNYSPYDLVFKNIIYNSLSGGGLIINNVAYNTPGTVGYAGSHKTQRVFTSGGDGNIYINTYFDHNNPLGKKENIPSNILVRGLIQHTYGNLNVFNDSGDITFNSPLTTKINNVIASQGNINFKDTNRSGTLDIVGNVIAGQDINITTKKLKNNGKLKAGNADRNLIIDDEMYAKLTLDSNGVNNMDKTLKSTYLNDKNNIKAIKDADGNIHIYNTIAESGSININADEIDTAGKGTYTYTDGYGKVNIVNNTTHNLIIHNLSNDYEQGVISNTVTGVKTGVNNAATSISSINSTLDVNGLLSTGNKNDTPNGAGNTTLKAKTININERKDIANDQIATVDTTGTFKAESSDGFNLFGLFKNRKGNTDIKNSGTNALNIAKNANLENNKGNITLENNATNGTTISGIVTNKDGSTKVSNKSGQLNISGNVTNSGSKTEILNEGNGGILFDATSKVTNSGAAGKLSVKNTKGNFKIANGAVLSNESDKNEDNLLIQNSSNSLIDIFGHIFNKKQGNTLITNNGSESGINIGLTTNSDGTISKGLVHNNNGNLNLTNNGAKGIEISGEVNNNKGTINIENNNTTDTAGIKLAVTGRVTNNNGDINIKNVGTKTTGIDVEGLINANDKNINLENRNSNIEIGEYDSDNDFYLNAANVDVSQINGSILNGIQDADTVNKNQNHDLGNKDKAYKTLIKTSKNLTINVNGGNIGSDTQALAGKESGFSVNASTRDYTESVNVNVAGVINANAKNNNNALINIRAKDSNLNVDNVISDGNIMLTAADWKHADINPTPNSEDYFHGYSIVNSASDKTKANVTGRNISLISSDNLGSSGNWFTYNQLTNGTISAMAENNLYLRGMGLEDNIWQLITKRGDMGIEFAGNASIREITAGKHLKIISKGANLTIYDLGKVSNLDENDDILFPHDRIKLSSVVPETIEIKVLDVNPLTRVNPNNANSTLNIYNAYLKGQSNGQTDVTLKADNIIAHAYDAASSPVSNVLRPNGFDAENGRLYANDFTDSNADKNLKASGFNSVGNGSRLVFDIQGVSPDDVILTGVSANERNYKSQEAIKTLEIFNNPAGFKDTVYKAKDVTLSVNSAENASKDNRGMQLSKLYSDNAYVDTKDLNLSIKDAFISNYAEFRNGNRGGEGGGHYLNTDYRWLTIVDNDYKRNLSNIYNTPITSQLYTKLTGSFALNMGNLIALETKAPVVVYNPYEVVNLPRTENSFYRLTYKDDKIQKTTATPEFTDIDKSTYKPTKRKNIRFNVADGKDCYIEVSAHNKHAIIISLEDLSKGGVSVVHDGSLKIGDKFVINLTIHDIKASPEVEVVRISGNRAGLKFINLDEATANTLLYMNMYASENSEKQISIFK